ncbi:hypothetical protein MVEN_02317200 [Mycena venus]|uniref:Uncharacterized protein n=1 Tax=Mycena venus TaxID=2733690 RepID=A0A8H6X4Z2_9AGAR|nr:hypothetical protein MVEN_02317200 [Mycena venus]
MPDSTAEYSKCLVPALTQYGPPGSPHLIRKIAVLLNDFIAHQDIVICDNNPTCGLHKRTKDGDKKFFQAYDSQMALDIIPGMHSEETSHFLDIVIHLTAEVAKSLTVVEFMGYLITAWDE